MIVAVTNTQALPLIVAFLFFLGEHLQVTYDQGRSLVSHGRALVAIFYSLHIIFHIKEEFIGPPFSSLRRK